MKSRLQDQTIKSAKAPASGKTEIKDAIVPGLMLRVTPRGAKSFCLVFKVPGEHPCGPSKTGMPRKGRQHRMTLGTYPMLSLADAREQARLLLEQVDQGIDPRPARLTEMRERHANTVDSVAKRFIAQECAGLASQKRIEQTLALHVLPSLGHKPISEVSRKDIHKLLDDLVAEDREGGPKPGAAREVLKHVHRLFDFAFDREIITSNPAHKMKRKDLKTNGEAGRALDDAELRAIWNAACDIGYPYGPWIKLLMLTGQRRSDWMQASRTEIDFDSKALNIPSSRYKTGHAHHVPLVGPAWALVEGLPMWNEGDYLFSTTGGRVAINSAGATKKKLDALAPTDRPWRIHDFRVTCKTRMAALGVKPEHGEAVLGHTKKGMEAVYNKHQYEAEVRAALDLYAKHLMEVVS